MPGVIDSTTTFIEHPRVVANRLRGFVEALLDDDPAYNANLSLAHGAANELASPPRRGLRHWLARKGLAEPAVHDIDRSWMTR